MPSMSAGYIERCKERGCKRLYDVTKEDCDKAKCSKNCGSCMNYVYSQSREDDYCTEITYEK